MFNHQSGLPSSASNLDQLRSERKHFRRKKASNIERCAHYLLLHPCNLV